jgi:hypothetical protein
MIISLGPLVLRGVSSTEESVYKTIKDNACSPPNEEEEIPWLIGHPIKVSKPWESLGAIRSTIPDDDFNFKDFRSTVDEFALPVMSSIAIDGFDDAPPSISSESEDHSLEVLISMDLEEEETVDEADSSSTPDEHAMNGHELKMFIDPT